MWGMAAIYLFAFASLYIQIPGQSHWCMLWREMNIKIGWGSIWSIINIGVGLVDTVPPMHTDLQT